MTERTEPFLTTASELTAPRRTIGKPAVTGTSAATPTALSVGRGRSRRERRLNAAAATDGLQERLAALGRLVTTLADRVPAKRLAPARDLIGRAGQRLELSSRHTVVALAGTTGSGKSTLFNALSGLDLSRAGARRPTTSEVHACVWDPDGADELLSWLAVPARRRTARESALDGQDQAALRGLVLLDMPDFDSIDEAHRHEVDRLVGVVDMIIWVLDPQKYADRTVHERLRSLGVRQTATAVVLNQTDRLQPLDVERCSDDLRRLLTEDGLSARSLHLTSARTGVGVVELRTVLAGAVADRQAAVRRLTCDLNSVTAGLADLTGPEIDVSRAAPVEPLAAGLSELAGVPGLVDGAFRDYRRRGRRATAWLFVRWALRGRDPKRRLEQERYDLDWLDGKRDAARRKSPARASSPTRTGLTDQLRRYLDTAVAGLPDPWPGAARSAVADRSGELAERLAKIPTLAEDRPRPAWWGRMTVLQWLLGACAVGGLVWLAVAALAGPIGYRVVQLPDLGPLPVAVLLLAAGVLLGVLAALVCLPAVKSAAVEHRRQLDEQLRAEVTEAVRTLVVEPVRAELAAYEQVRAAVGELG